MVLIQLVCVLTCLWRAVIRRALRVDVNYESMVLLRSSRPFGVSMKLSKVPDLRLSNSGEPLIAVSLVGEGSSLRSISFVAFSSTEELLIEPPSLGESLSPKPTERCFRGYLLSFFLRAEPDWIVLAIWTLVSNFY